MKLTLQPLSTLRRAPTPLPMPSLRRWQPLRIGLVELFHYDSEEFWFRDGHLLLRGNNGTGKSKVLSLTLPFLFDAQLKPSRIEPDGDAGKRMAWNLLMGSYDRRIGYAWIEFGRLDDDGEPRFLTLGAGLSAAAGRPQVDSWYFLVEGGVGAPRINDQLWLTSEQRVTLTRERLREAVGVHGQIFESATSYRRAVDERLFHLGPQRYDALIDTLIQLRQPQLSKKPDEGALSSALTEALPPLPQELLADVAEALGQLEEDRLQLEDFRVLARAVDRFEQRYRQYAGARSRRQARGLRQAQTEFDNASRARNDAHAAHETAQRDAQAAQTALTDAELDLERLRARVAALADDPAHQDARRLDEAQRDAQQRRNDATQASSGVEQARSRLVQAEADATACRERVERAAGRLSEAREAWGLYAVLAGIASTDRQEPLLTHDDGLLASIEARDFDQSEKALQQSIAARREQVRLLRQRHAELGRAGTRHRECEQVQQLRKSDFDEAARQRERADTAVHTEGEAMIAAWQAHVGTLVLLRSALDTPQAGPGSQAAFESLATWVVDPTGDDPLRSLLAAAWGRQRDEVAREQAQIGVRKDELRAAIEALALERRLLEAGVSPVPPVPHTRGSETRGSDPGEAAATGAPLWQLVDFHDSVEPGQRAGIEAALEACGLLDAWVFADGRVRGGGDDSPWHDTFVTARPTIGHSLARWLRPDPPRDGGDAGNAPRVSDAVVQRLLEGIAADQADQADQAAQADPDGFDARPTNDAETWIGADGRFRIGTLAGSWRKPAATYIGFAAREQSRRARIEAIDHELARNEAVLAEFDQRLAALARDAATAEREWQQAPQDRRLREAHAQAVVREADYRTARERLDAADATLQQATEALQMIRRLLEHDATDMRLPADPDALDVLDQALGSCRDALRDLVGGGRQLQSTWSEWERQRAREEEARSLVEERSEALANIRTVAEQTAERLQVLLDSVGVVVEELRARLAAARDAETAGGATLKRCQQTNYLAGQREAVAQTESARADGTLQASIEQRATRIEQLRDFSASGLLASALPDLAHPSDASGWTIEPSLTLARQIEQRLQQIKDDDDAWQRIQRQISEELTELQRALGALGHHATGETTDWGLIVRIVFQNRSERPDRLAALLNDEIAQRSELLTAGEREVLENHLQAEIAAEIQRLLQAAERQLDGINRELHKRPTSTGVRFRLLWQALSVDDGAPVGLETARKQLLNTSADLWSREDRQAIGAMLQQRIQAERERSDSGADVGSMLEQLVRALDYRHWHRFQFERWQDGQWRKLSGPASSGERALGLTVPLFAAVASFYSQSPYPYAPRLILLDEAFAGIDDAARAHCMGLVREFDLDFVITSEREWACYAELPGVSICQLQRREGIDAVHVSRWAWDGRARTAQSDPDRRFPPETQA